MSSHSLQFISSIIEPSNTKSLETIQEQPIQNFTKVPCPWEPHENCIFGTSCAWLNRHRRYGKFLGEKLEPVLLVFTYEVKQITYKLVLEPKSYFYLKSMFSLMLDQDYDQVQEQQLQYHKSQTRALRAHAKVLKILSKNQHMPRNKYNVQYQH